MAFALDGKLKLDAREFVKGTDKARKGVEEVGDSFGKLPKEAGKAADKVGDEFDELPEKGGKVGSAFGGRFGAMVVSGFAAVGVGAIIMQGIEGAIANAASERLLQGQFNLTKQEAAEAGATAGGLYADGWGESLQQVQETVARATRQLDLDSTEAATTVSRNVLAIASTFGEETGAVIRSTSQLLENDLAGSVTEAQDLMVAAFQAGGNEAGDLLDTIDEYSQHWAALGLSGEDALNQVVHGLQNGQRDADKLADAVKEMRLRVVENSEPVREALENIGLDADEVVEAFLAGGPAAKTAFVQIVRALKDGQAAGDDTSDAVAIIGTQFEDLGPKALESLGAIDGALDETTGRAAKLSQTVEATEFETFKRRFDSQVTKTVEGAAGAVNSLARSIAEDMDAGAVGDMLNYAEAIDAGRLAAAEFDTTLLDNADSIEEVREIAKKHAKQLGLDEDAYNHTTDAVLDYTNVVAVEWANALRDQQMDLKGVGNNLLDVTDYLYDYQNATDEATAANGENARSADATEAALAREQARLDQVTAAFARMSDELSDRSAYLDVQDGFAEMREEIEETGGVSERTTLRMKQDVIDYGVEVGNIPPAVVSNINAQIDRGSLANAEAALARLERWRETRLTVKVRAVDTRGNATSVQFGSGSSAVIALAQGTNFHKGGMALVGEEGPELVNLPRGSQVKTAAQTRALASSPVGILGGGRSGSNVTLVVNAGMGADGPQIGATIVNHLESFYRDGGTPPRSAA